MASVNKVTILGNLGRDPEIRHTPSNMAIATFSIATTYKAKDKEPENLISGFWVDPSDQQNNQ